MINTFIRQLWRNNIITCFEDFSTTFAFNNVWYFWRLSIRLFHYQLNSLLFIMFNLPLFYPPFLLQLLFFSFSSLILELDGRWCHHFLRIRMETFPVTLQVNLGGKMKLAIVTSELPVGHDVGQVKLVDVDKVVE